MEQTPVFKTECQAEREKRDLAIYDEWNKLVAVEGQSRTLVTEHLMKKYNIHSGGTWKIQCKLPPKTKRFCPLVLK